MKKKILTLFIIGMFLATVIPSIMALSLEALHKKSAFLPIFCAESVFLYKNDY